MARARTEPLPGVENGKVIKEISDAAEEYEGIRNKRMKALTKEVESKGKLMGLMKSHNLTTYRDDNYDPAMTVTLNTKDSLKVKREREVEADDDE